MFAAFFIGMATGVQTLVARNMGEGNPEKAAYPLNGGLLLNLLLAVPTTIFLIYISDGVMGLLLDDPIVAEKSSDYLMARLGGILALGCNFAFRGFWTSVGRPGFYLRTLLMMHAINILLNYLLIFGHWGFPRLETFGAGLGTTLSLFCGTLYYLWLAKKHASGLGFAQGLPSKRGFRSLIKISVPSALQQIFFAAGFTALFWIIGKLGTAELAGANAIITMTLVVILPCIAFGISANTLVSKAIGEGNMDDAYRWGWDVSKLAFSFVLLLGLPMIFFPDALLGLFLHDAESLNVSRFPLQLVGFGIAFDAISLVLMSALQGAGASKQTMIVGVVMQWGLFLPVAYLLGPVYAVGLTAIWIAQMVYRTIQMLWFVFLWKQKHWQQLKFHAH
jgi:putative MATE family efflux protein